MLSMPPRLRRHVDDAGRRLTRLTEKRWFEPCWHTSEANRGSAMVRVLTPEEEDRRRISRERVNRNASRFRKTMITALARKLLVALWKYANVGVVIEEATIKTA
jgi:hypothetical protein